MRHARTAIGVVAALGMMFEGIACRKGTAEGDAYDRTVQMSNGALLRLHGSGTYGHDSGFNWGALYKNGAAWEKAGAWWGGNNGNILACPAGATVLVAMADGKMAFVRSSGGEWKSFLMDVPDLELLKLEPAVVQAIRNSMQLPSDARLLYPYKAQFHPADRELWLVIEPQRMMCTGCAWRWKRMAKCSNIFLHRSWIRIRARAAPASREWFWMRVAARLCFSEREVCCSTQI